jgi:long-chain acyl-CoA synthetase
MKPSPVDISSPVGTNVAAAMLSTGADATVAILHKNRSLTYAQLRQAVGRVASTLVAHRHSKGDRIAILSENCPFQVIAYLAVIRAGLVAVPLQPELSIETLSAIARDAGIKAAFVSNRSFGRVRAWAAAAQLKIISEHDLSAFNADPTGAFPEIDPAKDLAALMFTSGSTGAPKGVMITHRNIECNARDIIAYMELSATDRVMVVLPFHYCFGASLLHTHLMVGGSLVLNEDFKLFPQSTLQELQRTACTGLAGVPSTYQILLRKSRFRQMSFPSLRWFQQAGGKLPNPFIQEILASFANARFFLMYGQTEATARLSYLPPERLADKLGSVGRGLASTQLEVLKPNGTPVTPGSEETGEIIATGPNVALGYWNDPEETTKFFKNGKLYTGDIAHVDAEGFIFIVERERELIKSGGNRVSAKEVEDVIAELPQVVEVAVLGAADDILGEAIHAFIVLAPGVSLTMEQLRAHCRNKTPSFKLPQQVHFIERMPHNSSGKILKLQLKKVIDATTPQRHVRTACLAAP